jgi:hypothetical protein
MLAARRCDGVAEDLGDDRAQTAGGLVIAFRLYLAKRDEDMGRLDLCDR